MAPAAGPPNSPNGASNAAPGRGAGRYVYERRRPELGTLHRVVRENLQTLYAAVEQGFAGTCLPAFVRREFESYLDCGLLLSGISAKTADRMLRKPRRR